MNDYAKILEKLRDMLTENGVEAAVVSRDSGGKKVNILFSRHRSFGSMANTATGEFCFHSDKKSSYGIFSARINVLSEIREQSLPYLAVEITNRNAQLPVGAFAWDPFDNVVYFGLKIPVTEALSEKELLEEADSIVALSMSMAEHYCTEMLRLANPGGAV